MKKYILCFFFGCIACIVNADQPKNIDDIELNNTINIKEAINRAIASNPAMLALSKQKSINDALIKQARQVPLPEIKIGVDDYAGSGDYKKTSSMKSFVGITQSFEMGHKKNRRIASARALKNIELLKADISKKEFKLHVIKTYLELYRLVKELEIQTESVRLANDTAKTVDKMVLAGELPSIDSTRVYVEFTREESLKKHLELDVVSAKNELAALWNSDKFNYEGIDTDLNYLLDLKLLEPTKELVESLPEVILAKSQLELAKADFNLAKSEAKSDIDFSVTYNKFRETSDYAFGLEASMAIGKKDSGNIRSAKYNVESVELANSGVLNEMNVKLTNAFREKDSIQKEAANIENMLLPAAKRAYQETKIAFESGEKSLVDLLDTQRAMLETSKLHLELQCKLLNAIGEYAVLSNQL